MLTEEIITVINMGVLARPAESLMRGAVMRRWKMSELFDILAG